MDTEYRYQNIAYRDLTELPQDLIQKTGKFVEELDLTSNRISDLRFLVEYHSLKSLVLDHNLVTSHVKLPDLPCLHTLWVNHNRIGNLSVFITTLAKRCPNLRYLSMMNNTAAPSYFNNGTFQQYIDYRYYVISCLPKLEVLDDKKIEKSERSEAERIYKPVRKRVKKKKKKPFVVD